MRTRLFLILLVFLIFPRIVFSQHSFQQQTGPFGEEILVEKDSTDDRLLHIWGIDANVDQAGLAVGDFSVQSAPQSGKRFLSSFEKELGVDVDDLQTLINRQNRRGDRILKYQQTYQGIPVHATYLSMTVGASGYVSNVHCLLVTPFPDVSISPTLDETRAISLVLNRFTGEAEELWIEGTPELTFYGGVPQIENDVKLTWKVRRCTKRLLSDSTFFVDANSGDILNVVNNLLANTISGTVSKKYYPEHYYDTPIIYEGLPNTGVTVSGYEPDDGWHSLGYTTTNSSGFYSIYYNTSGYYNFRLYGTHPMVLTNSYVEIGDEQGDSYTFTDDSLPPTKSFSFANDETNVYYHCNYIHDFVKNTLGSTVMDYALVAWVNQGLQYSAYSNGTDIYFGSQNGYQNARSSDVIYHEDSHCIVYQLYGEKIQSGAQNTEEGEAMDEGIPDYFACTLNNDNIFGESVYVDRNLDNTSVYGDFNPNASEYQNSLILSGSLWDMRENQNVGAALADQLVFDALEYADAYSFSRFLDNVLYADDTDGNIANGSPHLDAILQSFYEHEIFPNDPYVPPIAPQSLSLTNYYGQAKVNWADNPESDIQNYRVYRKLDPDPYHPNDPIPQFYYLATTTASEYIDPLFCPSSGLAQAWYKVKAVDQSGSASNYSFTVTSSGVIGLDSDSSSTFSISALPESDPSLKCFPNPFNRDVVIQFHTRQGSDVNVSVFDVLGRRVKNLMTGYKEAGTSRLLWNGENDLGGKVSSGIYLIRIESGSGEKSKRLIEISKVLYLQ